MTKKLVISRMFILILSTLCMFACGEDDKDTGSSTEAVEGEIEIYSWWTSPGEAEALEALLQVFESETDVKVVNISKTLSHGEDAREHLSARMDKNDPPDTFQLGPRDFSVWVEYAGDATDNRLEGLETLYISEGWDKKYLQGVLDVLKFNDVYYAVPVGMHRQNAMFYNVDLVKTPPATFAEFMALAETLHNDGTVPLAFSNQSWILQIIFMNVLAGTSGPDVQDAFYKGALDMTDTANVDKVKAALDNFVTLAGYANTNAADIGWDGAAGLVATGDAAMFIHGDWAKGYFISQNLVPRTHFDAVATPGTEDAFIYNVDAFALPAGAPNRDNALKFLRVIGNANGQEAFNKLKGSTPIHPDVDVSSWDSVAQKTAADYKAATVLHNVEVNQIGLPDEGATPGIGIADKLAELFAETATVDDVMAWITTNYAAATADNQK